MVLPSVKLTGVLKLLLGLLLCLPSLLCAQAVWQGMSREQVVEALGEPDATMSLGNREYLTYGVNVRVEFEDGIVTGGRGIVIYGSEDEVPESAFSRQVEIDRPPPPPNPAPIPDAAETKPSSEPRSSPRNGQGPRPEHDEDYDPFAEGEQMEEGMWGDEEAIDDLGIKWNLALFGVQITILFILFQIAFNWVGFPVLFRQLVILSVCTSVVFSVADFVIYDWLKIGFVPYLDYCVSTISTAVLIYYTTDAKNSLTALTIAIATNIVSRIAAYLLLLAILMVFL